MKNNTITLDENIIELLDEMKDIYNKFWSIDLSREKFLEELILQQSTRKIYERV